ncbi:olfactory receptor 52J3-like [Syngnathus acus]|uniref:olfactory receptor 52J3-like n=1 Tax=Syngnathus acus TaxID=161584 RepID=UPI0018863098|nr:olfactory receptor 52J3-like [Syngnathus acus]
MANSSWSPPMVLELDGLSGCSVSQRRVYFALALVSYVLTLLVNLTLMATVAAEKTLHRPIYVLVCNLCANGMLGASCFYPKLLHDLLAEVHVVSYVGCLVQVLVLYCYVFCEFASLTLMAYDRYVAICCPLVYRAIMTTQKVWRLLLLTWLLPLLETTAGVILTARLPLCGRRIHRLYCTNWALVKLSCVDNTVNNVYGFLLMFLQVAQAVLIGVSYGHLVRASLRSRSNRRRFVQTCVPHVLTLTVFTGSVCSDVLLERYGGDQLAGWRHGLAVLFIVAPPLLNPLIYGINLHQLRHRVLANLMPWRRAP